jgi:hypothetical protein
MHDRRRRFAVALLLVAVVGAGAWLLAVATGSPGGSVAAAADAPPLRADVTADGVAVGLPVGWRVQHVDRGRYELDFGRRVDLSVDSWETTAAVILRPLTDATWQVDFVDDHTAVDTSFSFTAASP